VDQGFDFECHIVGEGPLRESLESQITQLSLEDIVKLCGALPHQEVIEKYQQASIFVLPAILGANGDRDGVPNVILEAMAMELPVVSTQHSGIPEAVQDCISGLLVPPADEIALAQALERLLNDSDLRNNFGRSGRKTVMAQFNVEQNVEQLLEEFRT
jgi:glycosyltransferase involved in cell wall biosynthesis